MMNFKKAIPRRTFLRGAGVTLALPLLDAMVPAFAPRANAAANPAIRMGFVYVPNGIVMDHWAPAAEGPLQMTPTLEPLTPFRDSLLVLSQLDQSAANSVPGETGGVHTRPCGAYLTGAHPVPSNGADVRAGISVDQVAARELGKQTQIASLELALDPVLAAGICEGDYACAYLNTISWRSPTTPMPMEDKPRVVFERLFGDVETTGATARLARIRENRSLLDSIAGAVARLQTNVGPADRSKLSEYLDAVRDVERRVQLAEEQSSRELPTLERPDGSIPASYEAYAKLMFDLQVLAFRTDMTRVTTFALAKERSGRSYPEIGVPEGHHGMSHHRNLPHNLSQLVKINTFHIRLFAYYLDRLRSTPDGDGSLLDHVVVLYGGGISDGNLHLNLNLPALLAGGAGGKIKGGRHIRYSQGTEISNLYLTMLDIVGAPVDKIGDFSSGKLEGISI